MFQLYVIRALVSWDKNVKVTVWAVCVFLSRNVEIDTLTQLQCSKSTGYGVQFKLFVYWKTSSALEPFFEISRIAFYVQHLTYLNENFLLFDFLTRSSLKS